MPHLNETILDEKLAELEQLRVWTPRLISKLESFLRTDDEWALFRANPFTFAAERGVAEEEAIDLFLLATKVGLMQMRWSLLCPGCGQAVQSFSSLRSMCSVFHCVLCASDHETRLDDFVHVGFTVSPKVRSIGAHDPGALPAADFYLRYHFTRETRMEPGGPPFVELIAQMSKGFAHLEPHSTTTFEIVVEPGMMIALDVVSGAAHEFLIDAKQTGENVVQRLRLQDGHPGNPLIPLAPGPVTIVIDNDSDQRNSLMLALKPQALIDLAKQMVLEGKPLKAHFDKFLCGRRLLTSQTFRQVFGTETIRGSEGIGVRDISILFTDLKGSTAMYDRIGDLKAFALVNQHFECLSRAISRNRGAIVKTIGDAVMASFETPADAVLAAREMLREIESFNHEDGERELVLKVGVHRGTSIAVTLNDRLDFFGQTVNIAARVQGLADADEIYLTDEVYREPGVSELLHEFDVTPRQATLKGIQRTVQVYRVASVSPAH